MASAAELEDQIAKSQVDLGRDTGIRAELCRLCCNQLFCCKFFCGEVIDEFALEIKGGWQTGLCDCFAKPGGSGLCVKAFFCPCGIMRAIRSEAGAHCLSFSCCCCLCFYPCLLCFDAPVLAEKYQFHESHSRACLRSHFCTCCYMMQVYRETELQIEAALELKRKEEELREEYEEKARALLTAPQTIGMDEQRQQNDLALRLARGHMARRSASGLSAEVVSARSSMRETAAFPVKPLDMSDVKLDSSDSDSSDDSSGLSSDVAESEEERSAQLDNLPSLPPAPTTLPGAKKNGAPADKPAAKLRASTMSARGHSRGPAPSEPKSEAGSVSLARRASVGAPLTAEALKSSTRLRRKETKAGRQV